MVGNPRLSRVYQLKVLVDKIGGMDRSMLSCFDNYLIFEHIKLPYNKVGEFYILSLTRIDKIFKVK